VTPGRGLPSGSVTSPIILPDAVAVI